MYSEQLKEQVEAIFNMNRVSMEEAKNLASLITAASMMAVCSDITSKDTTMNVLLDVYQKTDDEEVNTLIGIEPKWVKKNIGYNVDFTNYSLAKYVYEAFKKRYDSIYYLIRDYELKMENNKSIK